jgi:hypothetical protein
MDRKKPGAAAPRDSSEQAGSEAQDWRKGSVPPLDSPDIRERFGTIIGEQAARKADCRSDPGGLVSVAGDSGNDTVVVKAGNAGTVNDGSEK